MRRKFGAVTCEYMVHWTVTFRLQRDEDAAASCRCRDPPPFYSSEQRTSSSSTWRKIPLAMSCIVPGRREKGKERRSCQCKIDW